MPASRTHPAIPADVNDAVYRTVHDFGVERLAALTGTPAGTIYNKANQHDSSHHKPTLADAVIWQVLSSDFRILQAMGRALGHVCVRVPDVAQASDQALLELVAKVGAEEGAFFRAIQEGLADRRFTRGEFLRIRRDGFTAIAAIVEASARIEGLIDD